MTKRGPFVPSDSNGCHKWKYLLQDSCKITSCTSIKCCHYHHTMHLFESADKPIITSAKARTLLHVPIQITKSSEHRAGSGFSFSICVTVSSLLQMSMTISSRTCIYKKVKVMYSPQKGLEHVRTFEIFGHKPCLRTFSGHSFLEAK